MKALTGLDSLRCEHVLPATGITVPDRWSETNIGSAAIVVKPETEDDVRSAIRVARDNKLTVLVAAGGHGSLMSTSRKTLYLDMRKFASITSDLHPDNGAASTVTVGGGALIGELLQHLSSRGFHTPLPNSNAVGAVGCLLAGGNTTSNGLHGWMADNVVSLRIMTAEGTVLTVDASSTGRERQLFDALRGAGFGLAVVLSATLCAHPLSTLTLADDDMIWTRSLILPPPAVGTAAQAFLRLQRPVPEATASLVFVRGPPGTPAAGKPIIILGANVFGSASKAEAAMAPLHDEQALAGTVSAVTDMVPIAKLNDRLAAHDAHGGHKAIALCRFKSTSADTIQEAFNLWQSVVNEYPSDGVLLVISMFNSDKLQSLACESSHARFIQSRDADFSLTIIVNAKSQDNRPALTRFIEQAVKTFRDCDAGSADGTSSLRSGLNPREMFDQKTLVELDAIKKAWDQDGLFWSPYTA